MLKGIKEVILSFIDNQYRINSGKNILSESPSERGILDFDNSTIQYIIDNREETIVLMRDDGAYRQHILRYMVGRTDRSVLEVNQFVNLIAPERNRLLQIYRQLIDAVLRVIETNETSDGIETEMASVMEAHSFSLRNFLLSVQDSKILSPLCRDIIISKVPCFEYSAELQMQVLGLIESVLQEPILDLGCGEQGHLVHYLRGQGLEAFGIDRNVKLSPYLSAANWLKFSFKPDYWGTIVSHMAFSNHFIHHHLRVDGRPEEYAQKTMEVLRSLKVSGSLYYAPGLPFIEDLLPSAKFRVHKRPIEIGDYQYPDEYPEDMNELFYSTQVLRIA